MNIKTKIKQYLDANVHDGEDRKGCHCDKAVFTTDELQELVEEACEYALKEESPKTIDFSKLPVDTLVSFNGSLMHLALPLAYPGSVSLFCGGANSLTAVSGCIHVSCDEIKLVEGQKVVWEGGECPLPDGVEVKVGYRAGGFDTFPCNIESNRWDHRLDDSDIIWYKITGRRA